MLPRRSVNGTNDSTGINIERSFIEILGQINPLEANILKTVYALPFENTRHAGVLTEKLPEAAAIVEEKPQEKPVEPPEAVKLALANLVRLGCLKFPLTWGGGEIFTKTNPTLIGKEFVSACTFKRNEI